ncbi:MAG: Fic family protein [Nanoarchaeota archaeon]
MAYIAKESINGKEYFYLVKNTREAGRWRKRKKYLGRQIPNQETLETLKAELDVACKPVGQHQFLSHEVILKLRNFRDQYDVFRRGPEQSKAELDFLVRFAHNSNAIEGNTLSLVETKLVLEDNLTPSGKSFEDVVGAKNTEMAYRFIRDTTKDITKGFILRLHAIAMDRVISDAGRIRTKPIKITGSSFQPPEPAVVDDELIRFLGFYEFIKKKYHVVEVAALTHLKFVEVHPFRDGNGRVARLLMNFVLLRGGFPPIIIMNENKQRYYESLELGHHGEYLPLMQFLADTMIAQYGS